MSGNNFLDNGTVMPHGLLSCDPSDFMRGMNKSYNNTSLRFGVITQIYSINDTNNISKLTTEYDVVVIEQDSNRSVAPVTYKNCLSVDALGSIADFFEKNYRAQTKSDNFQIPLTKGQNGPTVLVLCLDATTGKGVILGGLNHPNRPTTLVNDQPRLAGEYNGVAVAVNPDGSTSLTFKGATDSYGVPTNPSQGNTVFQIKTDGSFEFNHSTVDISANRSGVLNITTKSDTNIVTGGNTNVTTSGNTNLTTTGKTVVLSKEIDLNIKSPVPGNGILTSDSSYGVVDMITGLPLLPSKTVFGDV
jgi:hypothetical protein